MIKAKDINILLQETWITLHHGDKIELLDNPSSWREAFSEFKKELSLLDEDSQDLRFIYVSSLNILKVWIAAYAIHSSVINTGKVRGKLSDMWLGEFSDQVVVVRKPHHMRLLIVDEIPEGLMAFLSGLKLHTL